MTTTDENRRGFVDISVEQRGKLYYTVVETGDGARTISPPFRTERAANVRAQKALLTLMRMRPDAQLDGVQR